jgi:hypothetical protein
MSAAKPPAIQSPLALGAPRALSRALCVRVRVAAEARLSAASSVCGTPAATSESTSIGWA